MLSKVVLLAFVALAIVATMGPSASAAPPNDACALVTQVKVSAVLGISVDAGKPTAGGHDCSWSQNDSKSRGAMVLLEILGQMGNMTPADRFNTAKKPLPFGHITKTPVTGLGDDAVYVETSGATLYVKKGDFVFSIRVSGFPLQQAKAQEKTLAQEILARL